MSNIKTVFNSNNTVAYTLDNDNMIIFCYDIEYGEINYSSEGKLIEVEIDEYKILEKAFGVSLLDYGVEPIRYSHVVTLQKYNTYFMLDLIDKKLHTTNRESSVVPYSTVSVISSKIVKELNLYFGENMSDYGVNIQDASASSMQLN